MTKEQLVQYASMDATPKAAMLATLVKDRIVWLGSFKDGAAYVFDTDTVTWTMLDRGDIALPLLGTKLRDLVYESSQHWEFKLPPLDEEDEEQTQRQKAKKRIDKLKASVAEFLQHNKSIGKQFLEDVATKLKQQGKHLTPAKYNNQIQFKNGYLDLNGKTPVFKQRTVDMYVTNYIDRDYKPLTGKAYEKDKNALLLALQKVFCNNPVDRDCMLQAFAKPFVGEARKLKSFFYLLGITGGNGKSMMMSLLRRSLGFYVQMLSASAYSSKGSDCNKQQVGLYNQQQSMFWWVNECSQESIDINTIKRNVDGEISTTRLYKDGNVSVTGLNNLLIFTTNYMINMGSEYQRRLKAYSFNSSFKEGMPKEWYNDERLQFRGVDNLEEHFHLDTIIKVLADIAIQNKGKPVVWSEKWDSDTNTEQNTGNLYTQFIADNLVLTGNKDDQLWGTHVNQELKAYAQSRGKEYKGTSEKSFIQHLISVAEGQLTWKADAFMKGSQKKGAITKRGVLFGAKWIVREKQLDSCLTMEELEPIRKEMQRLEKLNAELDQKLAKYIEKEIDEEEPHLTHKQKIEQFSQEERIKRLTRELEELKKKKTPVVVKKKTSSLEEALKAAEAALKAEKEDHDATRALYKEQLQQADEEIKELEEQLMDDSGVDEEITNLRAENELLKQQNVFINTDDVAPLDDELNKCLLGN